MSYYAWKVMVVKLMMSNNTFWRQTYGWLNQVGSFRTTMLKVRFVPLTLKCSLLIESWFMIYFLQKHAFNFYFCLQESGIPGKKSVSMNVSVVIDKARYAFEATKTSVVEFWGENRGAVFIDSFEVKVGRHWLRWSRTQHPAGPAHSPGVASRQQLEGQRETRAIHQVKVQLYVWKLFPYTCAAALSFSARIYFRMWAIMIF